MAQQLAESMGAELSPDNSGEAAFELIPESGPRARTTPRFRAGDLVENRYRVFGNAATGGMGIVYVCEDTLLGRPVALKVMRSDSGPEQRFAERFFAEARITARLQNPHVAELFDCGTLNTGEPFMVMEFVDGSDLFSILRAEGRVTPEKVVRYILQVCEGLRAVHACGIVHCDLKPENLIRARTPDGTEIIKIVDFGVARQRGFPYLCSLASPGVICGSPNYMSPEQIRSLPDVDARSDVWALGVVMFELLTGRLPFVGSDENRICDSVLNTPTPSIADLGVGVSSELEAVVARCLKKAPEERFSNIDELMLALALVVLRQYDLTHVVPDPIPEPVPDPALTSPSVEVRLADETPLDEDVPEVADAPPLRRRYLGPCIAAVLGLSILFWGRSDTSRDARSFDRARVTVVAH